MRPFGTAKELQARRSIAARLFLDGEGPAEVAEAVGVSWTTANRWKCLIEEKGIGALAAKPHPGRTPRLSENQRQRLVNILLRGPLSAGFPTDIWTCSRVACVIEHELGVSYHPGHVWKVLRSLGWTLQKPLHRARKRNEQEIERWRDKEWPRIKKVLKKAALSS